MASSTPVNEQPSQMPHQSRSEHAHFAPDNDPLSNEGEPQHKDGSSFARPIGSSFSTRRRRLDEKDRNESYKHVSAGSDRRRHHKGDPKEKSSTTSSSSKKSQPKPKKTWTQTLQIDGLLASFAWVKPTATSWARLKPVIRSAIITWFMLLFLVINPVERMVGNASFLLIVFAVIQPAELPLTGILEREMFMLLIGLASWAWSCIAVKIAHACRKNKIPQSQVNLNAVYQGQYLEAGPAVVSAVFLAFGAAGWLYLKIRFGPSPFLFASIIGCIFLDITLTYTPLFPYPNYLIGTSVMIPLAMKSAVTIVVSVVFFPKSVNSVFVDRVLLVLKPISAALKSQNEQFKSSPLDPEFDFMKTRTTIGQSERAVPLLTGASRLLSREISFGLANGHDLRELERLVKGLLAPANGFSQYFSFIENDLKSGHFPQSKSAPPTRHPTPSQSRCGSPSPTRPVSPSHSHHDLRHAAANAALHQNHQHHQDDGSHTPSSVHDRLHRDSPGQHTPSGRLGGLFAKNAIYQHWHHRHSQSQTPSLRHSRSHNGNHHGEAPPVGVWEYLRFAQIEQRLHTQSSDWITSQIFGLIGSACEDILRTNAEAIDHIVDWLDTLNSQRYQLLLARFKGRKVRPGSKAGQPERVATSEVIAKVRKAREEFRATQRLNVVEPFREAILQPGKGLPHRYLFQAWAHQHTCLVLTDRLILLLDAIDRLEQNRSKGELWFPSWPKLLQLDTWKTHEVGSDQHDDGSIHDDVQDQPDDDWYRAQLYGMGGTSPRDPDALEPSSASGQLAYRLHFLLRRLFQGNLLFAFKAGTLTALVSLPFFLKSSVNFVQSQRGVWSLIMAQLTISRHRGESVFALVSRLLSTLGGAIFGLVIWYMSNGADIANPYGIMVVWTAFLLPLMAFRIYWPVPISAIIFCVTVALVVGYSWKDQRNPSYGSPGSGFEVAWRRFLEVGIGATAAVIWSILPPSSTLRQYVRSSHAASIHRLGMLHCRLLAFTTNHHDDETLDPFTLSADLISLRQKLRRVDAMKDRVSYETSLKGAWPTERYSRLFEVQLELSKLLSTVVVVSHRLGPAFSRALLRRTRFASETFTADVMAIYTLCSSALRTAQPLPQLSPILFSKYLSDAGFSLDSPDHHLINNDHPEDSGLPHELTIEVLESEEYMTFAVGVITLSAIVLQLDKLLLAVKELVGESYALPPELYIKHQLQAKAQIDAFAEKVHPHRSNAVAEEL
ncbi:unnamed protein product [Sympodiomycopsis kandeliae]